MANEFLGFILLGGFLIISFIVTLLLKKYTNAQTFFIFSMIKTKKPLWIFDKLAFIGKPLDWLTEFGLILGFGPIATDYLYGRQLSKIKRIGLFLITAIVMTIIFLGFDLLIGRSFSTGMFTKEFFYPITIVFGLTGFAGFLILTLGIQAFSIIYNFFTGQGSCPGVAPVLPGVDIPNVPISIPLFAWIPLLAVVVIHELMHGVVARKEKIEVKSTGMLLLGFLPIGGFVEPDETKLLQANERKQLHIYAAGIVTNLMAFLLTIGGLVVLGILLTAAFGPWTDDIRSQSIAFVQVSEVQEKIVFCKNEYPAPAFGALEKGMIVKEINGKIVNHTSDVTKEISGNRFSPITFLVEQNDEKKEINLEPNELGSFGFVMENVPNEDFEPPAEYILYTTVLGIILGFAFWFYFFNLLLGMMNYLPFPILDGGRITPILLAPYLGFLGVSKKETQKKVVKFFLIIILILLIINALPLFF